MAFYRKSSILISSPTRTRLENILKNEPSNLGRYNLLSQMKMWPSEADNEQLLIWLAEQRACFLKTLKAPNIDEVPMYVDLATENGGVKFLEDA